MKRNIFGMLVTYKREDLSKSPYEGYFHLEKKEIVIDKKLKGKDYLATKIHEEFEAIFYRIGGHQANMTNDVKEMMIESFAQWIVESYNIKPK